MDTSQYTQFPAELAEIIATHAALFGGFTMMADGEANAATTDGEGDDGTPNDGDEDGGGEGGEQDWKARSRSWEKRAKAHQAAAEELAALKAEKQTAEERAAERERVAEERAIQAEAKALRREIALESQLSSDDAKLLDDLTDEESIRRMAKRLAASSDGGDAGETGRTPIRRQKPRKAPADSEDAQARKVARSLFSGR